MTIVQIICNINEVRHRRRKSETGKYALNITYTKITETQVINLHQTTATLTGITFYIDVENNNPVKYKNVII